MIVGSHYDGMHVSQGSAFDDTSGCAIMLAEARAPGDYWRSHHLYASADKYTLTLTVQDARGTRKVSKTITVSENPPTYANSFLPLIQGEATSGSPLAKGDNYRSAISSFHRLHRTAMA